VRITRADWPDLAAIVAELPNRTHGHNTWKGSIYKSTATAFT
jgi:hypothetical protein